MAFQMFPLPFLCLALLALGLGGCSKAPRQTEQDDALQRAWDQYRYGDFDSAVTTFSDVASRAPEGSEKRTAALFGLGTTWDLRRPNEDTARAADFYRQTAEAAPESELAAWSLLALARMEQLKPVGKEPDLAAVLAGYQKVIDRFPTHPAGQEAFLYQQAARLAEFDLGEARRALAALEAFLREHAESRYTSSAHGLMGKAHEILGDERRALAESIISLETREFDPRNPKRDNAAAYWGIASRAEFRLGEFDRARDYYRRLIKEYPEDQRVFPAELALRRMDELEEKFRREAASTP